MRWFAVIHTCGDNLGYCYIMSAPKKPKCKSVEMEHAGRRTGMASLLCVQFVHGYEERMNTIIIRTGVCAVTLFPS